MDRNVVAFRVKSPGQRHGCFIFQIDIKNRVAAVAIKVAMLPHVWAKPGSPTLQGDLAHHSAFHKSSQAIIDCGHRNLRHFLLGANKDFLGGRVIAFLEQDVINLLALGSKSKSARCQALVQRACHFSLCNRHH